MHLVRAQSETMPIGSLVESRYNGVMSDDLSKLNPGGQRQQEFATTHWSVVLEAGRGESPASQAALENLCKTYWYPLYVFTRRQGFDSHDAVDLTQGFLADLLARDDLAKVQRAKGKFRSFLLASLKHFILNEIDRAKAKKRGGDVAIVSLNHEQADSRFQHDPWHEQTPEQDFEKQWAKTVLETVRESLRSEYYAAGKKELYDRLQPFISDFSTNQEAYQAIGKDLSMTEGAVKVAVHRLRQRFRIALRLEIANTVADEADIDDEIRSLFEALRT